MTRFIAAFLVFTLSALTLPSPRVAGAQDLGTRLLRERAGPYDVELFSSTPQGVPGEESILTVTVTSGVDPVRDATVTLALTNPADESAQTTELEALDAPGLFQTPFVPPNPGEWLLRVHVEGPLGEGEAEGSLTVVTAAVAAALPDEIARAISGPYAIVVTARPPQPLEGLGSRFSVRALTAEEGRAPLDADVRILFTNPETGKTDEVNLDQLPGNPEFHQSLVTFITSGTWDFTVVVESSEGLGTVDGQIVVAEAPSAGFGGTVVWIVVTAILLIGAVFFWRLTSKRA